jgi:hypothetical protein
MVETYIRNHTGHSRYHAFVLAVRCRPIRPGAIRPPATERHLLEQAAMFIAVHVRFEAHYGLKPDSEPSPKSATSGLILHATASITDRSSQERARLICVWIPIGMRPL